MKHVLSQSGQPATVSSAPPCTRQQKDSKSSAQTRGVLEICSRTVLGPERRWICSGVSPRWRTTICGSRRRRRRPARLGQQQQLVKRRGRGKGAAAWRRARRGGAGRRRRWVDLGAASVGPPPTSWRRALWAQRPAGLLQRCGGGRGRQIWARQPAALLRRAGGGAAGDARGGSGDGEGKERDGRGDGRGGKF
ncbi:hypothetical protein SETIT_5G069600v2 [Setaria italica]|uniref:Uncharacterized protein n=2 Tax=Setaria TaxID=4554 RepID=A0A368R2D8_SETIT|nr:hypothetical protein SETIT_5G069600v2 [Setaria italica]TKW12944.1 hypothetical protein SEVIR_5G068400v2 [Setaria viridis]